MNKITLRDGMLAIYKSSTGDIPVVLCDVKKDQYHITFRAKKRNSYEMLPSIWTGDAITDGVFEIENPEYLDDTNNIDCIVEVDENREAKENLKNFFEGNVRFHGKPFVLDDDQLTAVLSDQNTLVTARAGSGKTRVLVAKLIHLFEQQNLSESNVLAFCFNRDASEEISNRLNNQCLINGVRKYQQYNVAHTFHSFSCQAVKTGYQILENRKPLLKLIINELRDTNRDFANNVYQFFRKDTLRINRQNFHNEESFYKFIRNSEYTTLNGEKVKSLGEKYIADYLFEHGINYIYEKSFWPYKISFDNSRLKDGERKRYQALTENKKETKPDFYLTDYNLIWEHWALTGNESEQEKINFENLVGSYEEYLENKNWKQEFWSDWRKQLADTNKYNVAIKKVKQIIETTSKQFNLLTRENVEKQIEILLDSYNIRHEKLPNDVLVKKVWEKCIDGFTILIDQFINKLEQNYFDDINKFISEAKQIKDEKTLIYYRLGFLVYQKYTAILANNNNSGKYALFNDYKYDFNQVIYECSKLIANGELDEQIKELKWLLIDEYQDFSRLFDYLINSIISRNQKIKVFCVGDDWQAINRFAGSDLKYFKNFANRYTDAKLLDIKTNYRSEEHIVRFANNFMNRCGIYGSRQNSLIHSRGIAQEEDINHVSVWDYGQESIFLKAFEDNERNRVELAQYLKVCQKIIKENLNSKIMILSRSNQILFKELDEFNLALKNVCSSFMTAEDYQNNVSIKTVHRAKGEEADTVIILNVNESAFPVFNQNNELFEVFGQTAIDAVEDEEKLYYVALTRAKRNLYILYNGTKKSPYIL